MIVTKLPVMRVTVLAEQLRRLKFLLIIVIALLLIRVLFLVNVMAILEK